MKIYRAAGLQGPQAQRLAGEGGCAPGSGCVSPAIDRIRARLPVPSKPAWTLPMLRQLTETTGSKHWHRSILMHGMPETAQEYLSFAVVNARCKAFLNPKTSISIQKHPSYTRDLNAETSGDSTSAFLHCGDVLGTADGPVQLCCLTLDAGSCGPLCAACSLGNIARSCCHAMLRGCFAAGFCFLLMQACCLLRSLFSS